MSYDSNSLVHDNPQEMIDSEHIQNKNVIIKRLKSKSKCSMYISLIITLIILVMIGVVLIAVLPIIIVLLLLVITPLVIILILRCVFHISIFPGISCIVRTKVENSVAYHASMIYADRLISYLDVVKTFKKGSILTSCEQRKIQDQTDELVKILEFLLCDLAKESTNEPPRNSSFYKKIKELSDCFNTIPLICSTGENLTFSELGEYLEVINSNFESIDIEIYFEIESDKEHIEKLIFTISHDLMSYLRKLKCCWFLCQKTKIITPLQMRWSLVNKFHGRHLTIPISGSKRCGVCKPPQLDAYLLPCKYKIWQKEYLIIANYEVLLKLVDWATEHEKIISFNLSAVFLVEGNKDVYEKVISNTDIVFGNEDESSALGYFINLRYCININYIGI